MRLPFPRVPRRLRAGALLLLLLLPGWAACATLVHGTHQSIEVYSSPGPATVSVDGRVVGHTPAVVGLSRRSGHTLRIELAGYHPQEVSLERSVSGWAWGNVVFGVVVGLAVDAASGGLYRLTPEMVTAWMETGESGVTSAGKGDTLALLVVLEPDPEWVPIGALKPLAPGAAPAGRHP